METLCPLASSSPSLLIGRGILSNFSINSSLAVPGLYPGSAREVPGIVLRKINFLIKKYQIKGKMSVLQKVIDKKAAVGYFAHMFIKARSIWEETALADTYSQPRR